MKLSIPKDIYATIMSNKVLHKMFHDFIEVVKTEDDKKIFEFLEDNPEFYQMIMNYAQYVEIIEEDDDATEV
jgi:hypothetical protein